MAGWSCCWCCGAWISLCPAPATASATLHLAPFPVRLTTSMKCPRVSPLRVSVSSCRTTRSSGCSAATFRPPPPCCGSTQTTSPTYSHPRFMALTGWRSSTWGITGTWRPSPRTPLWVWVGYTRCICTIVASSVCLQGSLLVYIIFNISTYRCLDNCQFSISTAKCYICIPYTVVYYGPTARNLTLMKC